VAITATQRVKSIIGSLRTERNAHGFTQASLAKEINRSPSTVSAWEGNEGSIGLEEAWQLADLYGISLDQLAGRDIALASK
jgi:transcriptional regulator with XRE-family HTH domain